MEVKYVVYYETTSKALWLRNFITSFYIVEGISKLLIIYYDNNVVVNFFLNYKSSASTKHFNVKYQFVREKIHEHITYIKHVFMNCMLIDSLTKGLVVEMYHKYVINIGFG